MNKKFDVIVIGGSAAGIPAAITARRYYPDKSVLIIRIGATVPIPCGIPYIFGTVNDVDKNLISDAILTKNKVDLVVGQVDEVNKNEKFVLVREEKYFYDKLILATGSTPLIPPIEGIELKNIFPVHKNNEYLKSMLQKINSAKDIVIIGGGFIGVEFAEECKKNRDINITLIEQMPKCLMAAFDDEFCDEAEKILSHQNIILKCGRKVTQFKGNQSVESVVLDNGEHIKADAVILGIGATPNTSLARAMGLDLGKFKGIKVDANMRTSVPDIFSCGDCTEARSFFADVPSKVKLASTATMQARIAGANLYNIKRSDRGIIGVFSTALHGHAFACAGLTERDALRDGYKIAVGVSEGPTRHPGHMPGNQNMKVKLIFNQHDKSILGGQIFGALNAGELINAISSFVLSKFTADDIATFQLGTHPALTASPIIYQLVNAAEMANMKMQ
jgi:NADPH-dependent 2,4-dienoyl-CoA reductase/sulfur reductase-like enzyme